MAKPSSSHIPTSTILDASEIFSLNVNDESFKHFIVRLTQSINTLSTSLNSKTSGYHATSEFVSGKLYYPTDESGSEQNLKPRWRQGIIKAVNFGALPNSTTKSVPHGIEVNSNFVLMDMFGGASDKVNKDYVPISGLNASMDATNVNITTASNLSSYTDTSVFIEFVTF